MSGLPPARLHHEAGDLFFTDAGGREVYLAGSHTWTDVQDVDGRPFAWGEFVGLLKQTGANLTRLWATDAGNDHGMMTPATFVQGADGRFDLSRVNPGYIDRLVDRVADLRAEGIYASVMLFNGWAWHQADSAEHSPYSGGNNVNGVSAGPGAIMSLNDAKILAYQENFVRTVVDALKGFDNVLYEVANEISNNGEAWAWQRHMVEVVRGADAGGGGHPVGVTAAEWWSGDQGDIPGELARSGADWTSPDGFDGAGGYADGPPAASGDQVSIVDTDHIWGVGGMSTGWVWESFTRGHNVWLMDNLQGTGIEGTSTAWLGAGDEAAEFAGREGVRQTRLVAELVELDGVREAGGLSSTGFALADPGDGAFVVYAPEGGGFVLDLSGARGQAMEVRWLDLDTGRVSAGGTLDGGNAGQALRTPDGGAAVLVLTPRAAWPGATAGDDRLLGTAGADSIAGLAGADSVSGLGGGDTLSGGDGNDRLNGGAGSDSMAGGAGDDVYLVDSAGDTVSEAAGGGVDRVLSPVSRTLGAWVERLTLTGDAAVSGTGNGLANVLWGNAAANRLSGGAGNDNLSGAGGNDTLIGGAGADVLSGGAGADRFRYAAAAEGGDVVRDLAPGTDRVEVSAAGFGGGLAAGMGLAAAGRFAQNTSGLATAPAGKGQFVHETDAGRLWWDADGMGGAARQLVATLSGAPALAATDIVVIA